MLISRKYVYPTLLTSFLAFGMLEPACAGGVDDLPGYTTENALQMNRGFFIFLDGLRSPARQTPERREGLAQVEEHELEEDKSNWPILDQFDIAHLNSAKNPDLTGLSWVYGMNPGVDWRATFKGSPEMQKAFQQLFSPPDEKASEDEQEMYEIAKARFAQDWILAAQRQTHPLQNNSNIQTYDVSDFAQNIHRLLPLNKDTNQDEEPLYGLVWEIPSSRHLEFIEAAESLLTEDMDIQQRLVILKTLQLLSESKSRYAEAVSTIRDLISLVDPRDFELISPALASVSPEHRQDYMNQLATYFPQLENPYQRGAFAEAFARVGPQNYQVLNEAIGSFPQVGPYVVATMLGEPYGADEPLKDFLLQSNELATFVRDLKKITRPDIGQLDFESSCVSLRGVPLDQRDAFIDFVNKLRILSQDIPGSLEHLPLEHLISIDPANYDEAIRLMGQYRPKEGYRINGEFITQALAAAVQFPPKTSDDFFQASIPLLVVPSWLSSGPILSMLEKVGPENFQAFSDQAKDILPEMERSDLEILEADITPENFKDKLTQAKGKLTPPDRESSR